MQCHLLSGNDWFLMAIIILISHIANLAIKQFIVNINVIFYFEVVIPLGITNNHIPKNYYIVSY